MDESTPSILIVDDRPDKLLALEAVLEDLSLNIVRAYSGREALRHVLAREFAVVLLDVNMPDMDGFETARFIRQRRSSAHVPIIFLTAMGDEMYMARGYSLGAVDYILTPVIPQVLRSKVAVFVDLFRKTQQVQLQAERLRQRASQLHRLTDASLAVNSALSVQEIVRIATETARELAQVHHAVTVAVPGPQPGHAAGHAAYSDRYAAWRGLPLPMRIEEDNPVHALLRANNKVVRMTPAELDSHVPGAVSIAGGPPLRGLLSAPLTGRDGRNMGFILLSDKTAGEFGDDDQAILVQLAQITSIAIENSIFADEREANRLKDEFLSTLSHELRTPLNAISGWVQLLRLENVDGELGHALEVIERNVRAQTRLIEDLLDLSRVTTGKLRLNLRPVLLRASIEAAVEALRPIAVEKSVELTAGFAPDAADAVVIGDPDRLQQVFWNLLSNAAKFTPAGGRVSVEARRSGDDVVIAVSDTGEGIDPEFLPHVFDRFRQADSTSSRRHGGLGIGLTIVQHIVQLHRGSVAASSPGRAGGSTFTVVLPAATSEDRYDATPAPPDPAHADTAPSLQGMRILVVDDDADAREVVSEILQRCGAAVASAASAQQALEQIQRFVPDVLVTDLAMPEQDGYSLLQQLRQLRSERIRNIPAIVLTAYAHPQDQVRALQAGFAAHVAKPVQPAELATAVHRCANKQRLSCSA